MLGLVDILAMWIMIALTIASFFKVSKTAALMLFPYIAWVSFAAYLNYLLMVLNP